MAVNGVTNKNVNKNSQLLNPSNGAVTYCRTHSGVTSWYIHISARSTVCVFWSELNNLQGDTYYNNFYR